MMIFSVKMNTNLRIPNKSMQYSYVVHVQVQHIIKVLAMKAMWTAWILNVNSNKRCYEFWIQTTSNIINAQILFNCKVKYIYRYGPYY